MRDKSALLAMTGDLLVDREQPDEVFDLIRDVLAVPDLVTGNCECAYAQNPELSPGVTVPVTAHPRNIPSIAKAGFGLVTLANNHALDAGHKGLFEMQRHFEEAGILHCGTGKNLRDAREPAIVTVNGLTVAVLSYATFFPRGYEALDDWPGLAPIRSFTHCRDKLPNVWAPGTPPIITTIPHQQDLDNLRDDVRRAKEGADVVIAQLHSGDYHRPYVLSDFELETARFAVDCGADAVAAHHHHTLRGAEWYKDAPIFYGLGHFVFDLHSFRGPKELVPDREPIDPETDETYDLAPRKGWPLLPWHRDARMTMLAWVTVSDGRVDAAGFLPCMINKKGQVYPVTPTSKEGRQVTDYVRTGCEVAGLKVVFEPSGKMPFCGSDSVEMIR
jgi:poly-gamma-glutamate capsule biosynthesis protein CapA/YwtB (metallophosphatase superfamily)